MADDQIELKDYSEVLKELEETKPKNNLLLGNGFNLSLGIGTDYKNIVKQMKKNNEEYESVIDENINIEEFIGICKKNIVITDNPYTNFMKNYFHNKIKLDFMKAVTQIVTKEVKNIYQEKNEGIYLFLKNFDNFFTLNYDPFLYQLLMTFKNDKTKESLIFANTLPEIRNMMDDESKAILDEMKKGYESGILTINIDNHPMRLDLKQLTKAVFKVNMREYFKAKYSASKIDKIVEHFWNEKDSDKPKVLDKIDDGFRLFGNKLSFQNDSLQNVYFLHGAFHLYSRGKSIYKITQKSETALYERIEKIVEDANENIICIFSDKDKVDEIKNNEYLANCYRKLHDLEGSLLILGCSLSDNDSHIFEQINDSKVNKVYIASSESSKIKEEKKSRRYFPNKEVVFFDRKTISYAKG